MDVYTVAKEQVMVGHDICSDVKLELGVADTPELLQEGKRVIYEAFLEYLLCKWASEAVSEENGLREEYHKEIVNFFANFGTFHVSTKDKGALCFARNSDTKEMVAVFALAHAKAKYNGSNPLVKAYHKVTSEISDFFGLLRIGLPPGLFIHRYGLKAFKRIIAMDDLKIYHDNAIGSRDHLYLIQIAVLPTMRGKKIGEFMLNKLNKIADILQLPTYLETDTPRHERLYSKAGFQTRINYTLHAGSDVFEPNYGMIREPTQTGTSENADQKDSAALASS